MGTDSFQVSGNLQPLDKADYQQQGAEQLSIRVGMGEVESRGRHDGKRVVTLAFPASGEYEARLPMSPDGAEALAYVLLETAAVARGELEIPRDAIRERADAPMDPLPSDMRGGEDDGEAEDGEE